MENLRATNAGACGNFSPVPAKHQLLDVIGDQFSERKKAHAHLSGRCARYHLRRQVEWLNDDVAQHDLEDTVVAFLKYFVVRETRTHRVETNGERTQTRLTRRHQLPREIQQQVQLEIEAAKI